MLEFALIDVKDIRSVTNQTDDGETQIQPNPQIEALADLILACEGLLWPLVLKQVDIDDYEVISGHLTYLAAVQAREKDSRRGEMIQAFVISPKEEAAIQQQLAALQSLESSLQTPEVRSASSSVRQLALPQPVSSTKPSKRIESSTQNQWISHIKIRFSELSDQFIQFIRGEKRLFTSNSTKTILIQALSEHSLSQALVAVDL